MWKKINEVFIVLILWQNWLFWWMHKFFS